MSMGAAELAGFIANHGRTLERAKFLRTTVHLLNLGHLEVAQGTLGVEDQSKKIWIDDSYYELKNTIFTQQEWNKRPFNSGLSLIERPAREVDQGKESCSSHRCKTFLNTSTDADHTSTAYSAVG